MQFVHGGSPVADSLRSVGLVDDRIDDEAGEVDSAASQLLVQLLQKHGFRNTLDLRLVDNDGPEVAELMEELRIEGISIGDRARLPIRVAGCYRRVH